MKNNLIFRINCYNCEYFKYDNNGFPGFCKKGHWTQEDFNNEEEQERVMNEYYKECGEHTEKW